MSRFVNHPWTSLGQFVNRAKATRSSTFAAHLANLPTEERLAIQQAEVKYLEKVADARTTRGVAERDFAKGMLGVNEYVPAKRLTSQ
jgi:hypothetical protein